MHITKFVMGRICEKCELYVWNDSEGVLADDAGEKEDFDSTCVWIG